MIDEPTRPQPEISPAATSALQSAVAEGTGKSASPPSSLTEIIPDAPISAFEMVLSIVSQKLKKGFDTLQAKKSIRELSGGKFTPHPLFSEEVEDAYSY